MRTLFVRSRLSLERKLQAELDETRVVNRRLNRPEGRSGKILDRHPELGVVKEIEKFRAEIQSHVFPWQRELFDDREVRVHEIRTEDRNSVRVAEFTRRGLRKAGHVQELRLGLIRIRIATGNLVWALEGVAVAARVEGDARRIVVVDQREREARCDFLNYVQLPAAEKRVRHVVPIAPKLLASAERKIVNHARREVVVQVDLRWRPIQLLPIG